MVIDKILDRYDGEPYNPREFYWDMMGYKADRITRAMDYGTEEDIKFALCEYIIYNEYNPLIMNFINSANWLEPDDGIDWSKKITI